MAERCPIKAAEGSTQIVAWKPGNGVINLKGPGTAPYSLHTPRFYLHLLAMVSCDTWGTKLPAWAKFWSQNIGKSLGMRNYTEEQGRGVEKSLMPGS